MAAIETPVCDFGWPAPDFRLPGVDGREWTLADCRGERGTLVVFICNHCPFVKASIGRLAATCRELERLGVRTVAINSNDAARWPEDSFENMQAFAREQGLPFPYLFDETQEVAKRYGAVCTPDFFGFDAELGLQYRGRLDDGRTGEPSPGARNELLEAMRQVAETGRGPEAQTPSIGCSIKWKIPDED